MLNGYSINFQLILYVVIAYGIDRILFKLKNYNIYKKY
jgi:hypothetical protein